MNAPILSQSALFTARADALCRHTETAFLLPPGTLLSGRAKLRYAFPRQIVMWLLREWGDYTYPRVGELFGLSEAGARNGANRVRARIAASPELQEIVRAILRAANKEANSWRTM